MRLVRRNDSLDRAAQSGRLRARLQSAVPAVLLLTLGGSLLSPGTTTAHVDASRPAAVVRSPGGMSAIGLAGRNAYRRAAAMAELRLARLAGEREVPAVSVPVSARGLRYGVDVSWPQCEAGLPPLPVDFAVVGLTDGHAESVNPCLREQVTWARAQRAALSVYVVPNSPTADTLRRAQRGGPCPAAETRCDFYRSGVAQAEHALDAAAAAGVKVRSWWLDVEETPEGSLWSKDLEANQAVLRGWADALTEAGRRVGVYSTDGYWTMITGGMRTRLPEWVAVGEDGIETAREACTAPFSTGPVVVAQWWTGPLDGNLVCPAQRERAASLLGPWTRVHSRGVPPLLVIPVPHPHPAAPDAQRKHHHKKSHHKKRAHRHHPARAHRGRQQHAKRHQEPSRSSGQVATKQAVRHDVTRPAPAPKPAAPKPAAPAPATSPPSTPSTPSTTVPAVPETTAPAPVDPTSDAPAVAGSAGAGSTGAVADPP